MEGILGLFDEMEHEYRRQLLHAAFGLLILLFPFISSEILLFLSFLVVMGLTFLPEDSRICRYLYMKPLPGSREMLSDNINQGLRSAKNLAISVFILMLISSLLKFTTYHLPLYVIAGAIAISTFGTSAANFMRHRKKLQTLRIGAAGEEAYEGYLLPSSIVLLGVGIITAYFAGIWLMYWQESAVSINMIVFLAVIGSITGALFESIPSNIDNNLSVPLGSGMMMWLFSSFGYSVPPQQMIFALVFSIILGYLAYRTKIADLSALFSAALLGVLIIVFSELFWFILLLTFFILGGGFTKYKYRYKESIGLAQSKGGVRSYENVFSNSTAALVLAVLYGIYPQHAELIIFAYLGTVATATGDTLASEVGTTAHAQPIMITTLKPTKAGVDGAVTVLGEIAALLGAMIIGVLPVLFGKVDDAFLVIAITTAGGFLGTNVDSILGATLQKKGVLTNSGVNFVATFAGAIISGILYLIIV
ncbi:TIGR00297 family protein [Methanolobus profundi]|uniref:TIGR00297 family protein n=1 Tax=Methanolobus profundi TaxID=487685 RepID=A0A1I4PJC2_9EURY|nr:TIGR00297 family protein [Methanolobus profundi]SFM27533.1 TIGR00297 family protein [Methanolobus profundi]